MLFTQDFNPRFLRLVTGRRLRFQLVLCDATAYKGFAQGPGRSAKAVSFSAKALPRVALGKDLSAHFLSAKRSLPRAIHRVLETVCREPTLALSKEK